MASRKELPRNPDYDISLEYISPEETTLLAENQEKLDGKIVYHRVEKVPMIVDFSEDDKELISSLLNGDQECSTRLAYRSQSINEGREGKAYDITRTYQ